MNNFRQLYLNNDAARRAACKQIMDAPIGWLFRLFEPKRTSAQNALLWGLLIDISKQVQHCDQWLDPEDWKDLLTAHFRGQRMMMGLDKRGLVALGMRTSKMSKSEMTEFIEMIRAWGKTEAPVTVEFFDERVEEYV